MSVDLDQLKDKYHIVIYPCSTDDSGSRAQLDSHDQAIIDKLKARFTYTRKVFGKFQAYSGNYASYSCITPTNTVRYGMIVDILKWIKKHDLTVYVDPVILRAIQPKCHFIQDELIQPHATFKYRDYQEAAIRAVQRFGRGIIDSPTSSGKSLILYGICSNIAEYGEKTLIIVPRIQLVQQFYKEWTMEYGFKGVSFFSKEHPHIREEAKVVITNYQFLIDKSKNKKGQTKASMVKKAGFKALIIDEAHTLGEAGSWLSNFVFKSRIPYILGCTGTVPDDKAKRWNVLGAIGPVIFKQDIVDLQDRDQIAKIRINHYEFEHNLNRHSEVPYRKSGMMCYDKITNEVIDATKMYHREFSYLEGHKFCNDYLLQFVKTITGNTVILVDHIAHAHYLYDNLKCENKTLITGATDLKKRLNASAEVDANRDKRYILICVSSCFGTGTSIKAIDNLILFSHGKSLTKIIQGLGRCLRKTKGDGIEEYGNVYDFYHNQLFSNKHHNERVKLYTRFYKLKDSPATRIIVPANTQK